MLYLFKFKVLLAIFLGACLYCCLLVVFRWRSDLDQFRSIDDRIGKAVILTVWVMSFVGAVILMCVETYLVIGIVGEIYTAIGDLL